MLVRCVAAMRPGQTVEPWEFDLAEPTGREIILAVTHCSVGHGDAHFLDGTFGLPSAAFPMVAGHEVVGHVVAIGPDVDSLRVGQRVGVGYQIWSCGACSFCERGDEQLCQRQRCLVLHEPGGFATHMKADCRFVVPIPDGLESAEAAPLLCSGLTAFSAIRQSRTRAGMHVGVVGVGGLGHLAVGFLVALGCQVTAITGKEPEMVIELGARTVVRPDAVDSAQIHGTLDVLLVTSVAQTDWGPLLRALVPDGQLVSIGSPPGTVGFPVGLLNDWAQRSVQGSYIGSPRDLADVMAAAVAQGVRPQVEVRKMSELAVVLDAVRHDRQNAFRTVVENDFADSFDGRT